MLQATEANHVVYFRVKEVMKQPECSGLQLQDFLIKPVQRLWYETHSLGTRAFYLLLVTSKYPLLFRALLKATPVDHQDYHHVQRTCAQVEAIADSVNENAAEILNFERVAEFNKTVVGYEVSNAMEIVNKINLR